MRPNQPWRTCLVFFCATAILLPTSAAQENPTQQDPSPDPFQQLELRVANLRPNAQCIVDRGARDLVAVDDRVVLTPRGAPSLTGRVVQVEERTALVQLLEPQAAPPVGTRGHVLLPRARVAQRNSASQPTTPPSPDVPVAPTPDEWRPGMPLLGRRRPPQPHERASVLRGRVYGAANLVRSKGDFDQSFLNTGVDVDLDNVGGTGGVLRFHGAYNHSTEFDGRTGDDLRLFELSYERGGTRFHPWRYQIGRFLPRDMPEFGLLDGIEVGYRREGGDRFGASLGYLPELDDDLETLADLQVAAWYLWSRDVGERLTFGLGYQRTWHRGSSDRDLLVAKARFLPDNGWDVSSAVWIDVYDGDDDLKDETVEVTRANVFASRRWQRRGGIELFYDHEEYPELRRDENPQTILPLTLIDAHVDRVSAHLWTEQESTRWFTRLTGWADEETTGGAVELGVAVENLIGARTRTTFALFELKSPTNRVRGLRLEHGGTFGWGRLDALYELGFVTFDGFPSDRDDLLQHRLAGVVSTDLGGGWDATFTVDATFYDDEFALGAGIYLQRLF
jgi:hypothetical protein